MTKITKDSVIFVTGGAGYIGSTCVSVLKERGYKNVVIFDNLEYGHRHNVPDDYKLIVGDLRDYSSIFNAIDSVKPDAVIHFAAYALVGESCNDPLKYFYNNVTGGINLLRAMEHAGCTRLIFSSTCATYGIPDELPITEETPQHPINPYGQSKWLFENILKSVSQHKTLDFTVFRYFNACGAYGGLGEEHDPETHLIPNVLLTAIGKRECLEVFGDDYDTPDGTCIRDYIHVYDLALAHIYALEQNKYGFFNLGTGTGSSNLEILNACEKETGLSINKKISSRRPGDPPILVADAKKANKELGWTPNFSSISTIIKDAWQFMRRK